MTELVEVIHFSTFIFSVEALLALLRRWLPSRIAPEVVGIMKLIGEKKIWMSWTQTIWSESVLIDARRNDEF